MVLLPERARGGPVSSLAAAADRRASRWKMHQRWIGYAMVWNSIHADVRIVTFPVHLYSTEVAGRVLPGDGTRFGGACRRRLGGSSESGLHRRLCGRCLQ